MLGSIKLIETVIIDELIIYFDLNRLESLGN